MDTIRYTAALEQKFNSAAKQWPDLHSHIFDVSIKFQLLVEDFCNTDATKFRVSFDRASSAYSLMLRSYSADVSAYRRVLDQSRAALLEQGRSHFFDQCRDFLTTLHRAKMMGQPHPVSPDDVPQGNVLMYRATTFLKGIHVSEDGYISNWTLRNHSSNEASIRTKVPDISIIGDNKIPTSDALFAIRNDGDLLLIAPFCGNPLVLHCLVCGPSANLLRQARAAIHEQDMSRFPAQSPIIPEGKDDYFAVHHDYRRRGGKRFNPPTLLAIASNRYWKFTRELRIADIVRKLPKVAPSHLDKFDFSALCRQPFEVRACVSLGGYVSLYHLHLPQLKQDVIVLEGFGRIFMIGRDFSFGDASRFKERMTPYLLHFADAGKSACETRIFYQVACKFFNFAPAALEARGLTLSYGNWRVGDCSFALTSIRQLSELGYDVDILDQDSELLGFHAEDAAQQPHVRALFGEAAMARIHFNKEYVDGLSHLVLGSLGLAPRQRFPFQGRGRTYGNLWQKTMFPDFDGRRRDLVLGWPTVKRDPPRPFGIFFTLDLEKRRWIEQEEFLEKLIIWTQGLATPVKIFLNGMTGYRHAHRLNVATLKTFIQEESVVAELKARVKDQLRGDTLSSIAELSLDEKFRIIHDQIDYCIGPLGSGTVVPSVMYSKPSLLYSSHALYKINRDSFKNLDLLIGPYSELVPHYWVTDSDARDHRFFPEAEMTNYSISPDRVLELAKFQLSYHLHKNGYFS